LADLVVGVVSEPAQFRVLEPAWRELLQYVASYSAAQGFPYVQVAWEQIEKLGGELKIVTVRRGQNLVAVWPLYSRSENGRVVARHLGCGSNEEYSGPLIRDDEDADQIAARAFELAKTLADILEIYGLRWPSPLAKVIAESRVFEDHHFVQSPVTTLRGFDTFEGWLASKSSNFRAQVRTRRKRLSALGDLRFTALGPEADIKGFVDWLMARKLELVNALGVGESWVRGTQSRDFFEAILRRPSSETGVWGFALTLNGKTIAGAICTISDVLEYCITAYDDAYARYSPGSQIVEGLARRAITLGVDLDFRIMTDDHKRRWCDRWEPRATYVIATKMRGIPTVLFVKFKRLVMTCRRDVGQILRRLKLR
jgi:CelD/BcsL family acetyltransferase involved in cellulose biosynthesis